MGDVGGCSAGRVGNFKGHHDGQVSDATIVTRNWSSCHPVADWLSSQGLSGSKWPSLRLLSPICIVCPMAGAVLAYVCLCNCCCECGLCRRAMHVWDVHSCRISYCDSLGPSAPLSGHVISTADALLQQLTHITSDWLPTWVSKSADAQQLCDVMWLISTQRRMCSAEGGALCETMMTVSLRTEQCLDCSHVSITS